MSGEHDIFDTADLEELHSRLTYWKSVAAHFHERFGSMTSSTSTATPMKHVFESRVAEVKSPKSDINDLILDYLTMEGYHLAAAKFSKEANLQPQQESSSIKARQEIMTLIHKGRIEEAIESLNELDPEILDTNPSLHFALLRLQLVELIRECDGGDITPALDFATQQLGPRAPMDEKFLEDLERTMALLIFPHDSLKPELAEILHPDLRRKVADQTNKAILYRHTKRRDAALRHLLKTRGWAENKARELKKDLPERIDLGLNGEEGESAADGMHENGHEPMITT